MTKIEEFEARLIKNGMSEADFDAYETLLKRVRSNYHRRQHCYMTAARFPKKRADQAVALIRWGLARYPDDWFTTYTSYAFIGHIYEKDARYEQACEAFSQAYAALGEEQLTYRRHLAGDLMWMRLHVDRFRYSEQLEGFYTQFNALDDFSKSFADSAFRLAVARLVIALHAGNTDEAGEAYRKALAISSPGFVSRVQSVLDRHGATDRLTKNTPECTAFLKTLRLG